jgi:hypothetical protein
MELLRPTEPIQENVEEALQFISESKEDIYEEEYFKHFPDSAATIDEELQMDELVEYARDHRLLNQSQVEQIEQNLKPRRARIGLVANRANNWLNQIYESKVSELYNAYTRIKKDAESLDREFQSYSIEAKYLFLEGLEEEIAENLMTHQDWLTPRKKFVQEDMFEDMETDYPVLNGLLETKSNIGEMQRQLLRETADIN